MHNQRPRPVRQPTEQAFFSTGVYTAPAACWVMRKATCQSRTGPGLHWWLKFLRDHRRSSVQRGGGRLRTDPPRSETASRPNDTDPVPFRTAVCRWHTAPHLVHQTSTTCCLRATLATSSPPVPPRCQQRRAAANQRSTSPVGHVSGSATWHGGCSLASHSSPRLGASLRIDPDEPED